MWSLVDHQDEIKKIYPTTVRRLYSRVSLAIQMEVSFEVIVPNASCRTEKVLQAVAGRLVVDSARDVTNFILKYPIGICASECVPNEHGSSTLFCASVQVHVHSVGLATNLRNRRVRSLPGKRRRKVAWLFYAKFRHYFWTCWNSIMSVVQAPSMSTVGVSRSGRATSRRLKSSLMKQISSPILSRKNVQVLPVLVVDGKSLFWIKVVFFVITLPHSVTTIWQHVPKPEKNIAKTWVQIFQIYFKCCLVVVTHSIYFTKHASERSISPYKLQLFQLCVGYTRNLKKNFRLFFSSNFLLKGSSFEAREAHR